MERFDILLYITFGVLMVLFLLSLYYLKLLYQQRRARKRAQVCNLGFEKKVAIVDIVFQK